MRRFLKNVTGSTIQCDDAGAVFPVGEAVEISESWDQLDNYLASVDLKTEIMAGNIQVGSTDSDFYEDPLEGYLYFKTRFDDEAFFLPDSTSEMEEITVAIVEDQITGIRSTTYLMNMLTMMREIYNNADNPIYDSGVTPILGASGWAEDHATRIGNIETIHGDLGWHTQQVVQATYQRPKDLLIYYGWINSFNSATNGWDNEKVAQDMADYGIIVLGDGIQDPGHGDYSNTSVVIPRIKALNPNTLIFGYVTLNQDATNFEDKADQWDDLGVHGIFFDEAGYDYGTTTTNGRAAFNDRVDYVHALTDANLCFINAWNMDHIIGTTNDASYPNSTWNPSLLASNLTYNDWYLLESFAVNTTSYSGNNGYASKSDWSSRGTKAIGHRNTYGINLASVGIIANADANDQNLFDFCFASACMWALEANGSSDTSYGASSAAVEFHERADVSQMGRIYSLSPAVQVDTGDSDVYWRYVDYGKFKLDFSSGAQDSLITKW